MRVVNLKPVIYLNSLPQVKLFIAISSTAFPIAKAAVAAGEGAFNT